MPRSEEDKGTTSKPLPKDLQNIVDKEESDKQIRGDYENSWATTPSQNNFLEQPSERADQTPAVSRNSSGTTQGKSLDK
ncbi:hypothetical protein E8E15_000726 [Penicillium rubens]|nr:hypothetical protein E8E15_000726 [Penicillium rubens]